jgi:hypothetical protein
MHEMGEARLDRRRGILAVGEPGTYCVAIGGEGIEASGHIDILPLR